MSSISSFHIISVAVIISVVVLEPKVFLCILVSAAAVNPNASQTLLANGLITFFINGNPVFSNGSEVYQKTLLIVSS